jgi:hypothetical protein
MTKLYVLGGRQRRSLLKEPVKEWRWYDTALILEVDTATGAVRTCVEYKTPPEVRAGDNASINFHSGALIGDTLYTCTATEVLIFKVPQLQQIGYFSLPCFNDLHHVTPTFDGHLLVVNTGLDMVVKCTRQGQVIAEWSVLDEPPFARFSREIDYRKWETTKPHVSHPNYAFELDGETWVTRFNQRDAVSLNGSRKRIEIAIERPHDGIVAGERILFTSIDGKVVIVNRHTLRAEQIFDLRAIQDRDGQVLPAWCRGLLPVDERKIWVGLTRVRTTQFRENIRWIKTVVHEGTVVKPTHIALFDIVDKQCLKEFDLEPYGMNAIYGIFHAPTANTRVPEI